MKTELDTRALLNVKDLCEYHNKNTEEFQSGNSIRKLYTKCIGNK